MALRRLPMTAVALAATGLLLAAVTPQGAFSQEQQATITIEGPSRVSASAQSAQLNIDVKGAANLAGFQFVLSFDSSVFKAVSVAKTDFLSKSGRQIVCQDPTIEAGAVRFVCVTLGSQPPGVDGEGTLAVVTLQASSRGATRLALSRVKLVHPDGSELPSQAVDGKLTVGGSSGGMMRWWGWALLGAAVVAAAAAAAALWQRRRRVVGGGAGGPGSDVA